MSANLGEEVLGWMLRRLHQAVRIEHDLVLVHDSPSLADVGPTIDVRGDPWRVARVTGELTLRDALPEADRLIAIVPASFPPPPMDLAARTYLKRVLDVRAEDVVAASSGRFCEALVDEGLAAAVFDSIDTLRSTAGRWSLGELVTAREVRAVLVGAELGAARLNRERDWELLARWILEGAPTFRAPTLVRAALEEAQPRTGAWLGWALTDGTLQGLCTAGALLASEAGAQHSPAIPGLGKDEYPQVVELVDTALREVWRTHPARAAGMLLEAERIARELSRPPLRNEKDVAKRERDLARLLLLRVPLEGALVRYANLAAEGNPPDDVEIEGLKRNLHAPSLMGAINAVADLARLARFARLDTPASDGDALPWFTHALRDVAWADLSYRRVRREEESLPEWLRDPARIVLSHWTSRRDQLNAAFATSLSAHWPELARSTDSRNPLPLHQVTRCLVRRLVDDGSRVLLLVLDGCDLASFLEILASIPGERRIGLALPEVRNAVLRDDLSAMGPLGVAISPLPTVTSHSRRALFAGDIPGNSALDNTESGPANASEDLSAWRRNTALGDIPRRLLLKAELGATGQPLLDALRAKDSRVLAAVFNGVDDALSSHEITALPAWSFSSLGAGAAEAVQLAIDEGWCVLVTADHGHTPFIASDRRVQPSAQGQRFSATPCEGTVGFQTGPLPRRPLHLLTRFGAWFGQQRRGFHGGAGIEEVVVPLAFLGRVRGEQEGRAVAPGWWWSAEGIGQPRVAPRKPSSPPPRPNAPAPAPPKPPSAPAVAGPALDPRLHSLGDDEKFVVALIQQNQSVRLSTIVQKTRKPPNRASGFMQVLVRKLHELGCPCIKVEPIDNERIYRYQPVERGNQ